MDRVSQLQQFLSVTPDDSFLRHALALEYMKSGDDAAARRCFEGLLEKDPQYVGSYYHLAKLLERTGLEQEAAQVYQRGMRVAEAAGERRALGELRSAYEELTM
jgi:Tfp pilus assembly protein PilF